MAPLDRFSGLYARPERLSAGFAHERIYAPPSYAVVRELQIVPAVHVEALAMAAWFPVCWRRGSDGPELVVLRSLAENADGRQPRGSPRQPASLPLALRCYPVAIHPDLGQRGAVMVERAIADKPTDLGAPLALPDGRPSRGLQNRYRAALIASHAAEATAAMTAELEKANAFQPWDLSFATAAGQADVHGLLHASGDVLDGPHGRALLQRFGVDIAALLAAHRLSLFRIGELKAAFERRPDRLAA
jgi:hypothetical protein